MVKGSVVIDQAHCKGCELCVLFCPQQVLALDHETLNSKGYHPAKLIADNCTGCGVCPIICPDVCITVYREVPVKSAIPDMARER